MGKLTLSLVACLLILLFNGCTMTNEVKSNEDNNQAVTADEMQKNEDEAAAADLPLSGRIICVDAGHGLNSYNKKEPVAPDSSRTKIAFSAGTKGKNLTEEELNLIVALKLESKLKEQGATVYMTRTTHESDMTNIDRAELANEKNADISVRIHADGLDNSSAHGISMLVPSNKHINNSDLCKKSRQAGEMILEEVIESTGAANRGVVMRDDLTGFNWTRVHVVLLEMGFMTNPNEDAKLETEEYQNRIVDGIVNGLLIYFQ